MTAVDRKSPEKLYIQLKDAFRERIRTANWSAGSQIPSEAELCGIFGVSKITVRQAVSGLVDEGLLRKVQGKGTFVVPDAQSLARTPSLAMKTRLTDDVEGQEIPFDIRVLENRLTTQMAEPFRDETEVAEIRRLRLVQGEPVLFETTQVPRSVCPDILEADLSVKSIYGVLAIASLFQIARAVKTFEIGRLGREEAELLQGEEGERALVVHRILYSGAEIPMAYTRSVTISERYKFQTVYERI